MCSQTGSRDCLGWWRRVANTTPNNWKRIELSLSCKNFRVGHGHLIPRILLQYLRRSVRFLWSLDQGQLGRGAISSFIEKSESFRKVESLLQKWRWDGREEFGSFQKWNFPIDREHAAQSTSGNKMIREPWNENISCTGRSDSQTIFSTLTIPPSDLEWAPECIIYCRTVTLFWIGLQLLFSNRFVPSEASQLLWALGSQIAVLKGRYLFLIRAVSNHPSTGVSEILFAIISDWASYSNLKLGAAAPGDSAFPNNPKV